VKIIIHIRHIRGHTFDVEVDRDADCIGVKVAICTSQQIPVERQRLVYSGKEVADEVNLVDLGIDDGSTIFLVERVENSNPVPVSAVESQVIPEESVSVSVPVVQPMSVNSQYQPCPVDGASRERIQAIVDLAFWVRVYCIFGAIVRFGCLMRCWGSVLPLLCFVIGYIGCRKLNRCCLFFPMLLAIVIGPVGFVFVMWKMATHFRTPLLLALFVTFLHIIIMASIGKLRCRIKHMRADEKDSAVAKIRAGIRCWCC